MLCGRLGLLWIARSRARRAAMSPSPSRAARRPRAIYHEWPISRMHRMLVGGGVDVKRSDWGWRGAQLLGTTTATARHHFSLLLVKSRWGKKVLPRARVVGRGGVVRRCHRRDLVRSAAAARGGGSWWLVCLIRRHKCLIVSQLDTCGVLSETTVARAEEERGGGGGVEGGGERERGGERETPSWWRKRSAVGRTASFFSFPRRGGGTGGPTSPS